MIGELALLPSRRAVRRMDVVAVTTTTVFLALGVFASVQLLRLSALSGSLHDAATAIGQTGQALATIAEVPVVGDPVAPLADSVSQTADSTKASAEEANGAIRALAVAVGLAVALIPAPLLAGYLSLRRAWARERRGLRRKIRARDDVDPMLVAHLAHGAVSRIPYARLRQVSRDPWADLAVGRHRHLAAAELCRLGVPVPAAWTAEGTSGTGGNDP